MKLGSLISIESAANIITVFSQSFGVALFILNKTIVFID